VAGVLPKSTASWPAAPEKFWPTIVTMFPAVPLALLKPLTTGRQVHHLEIAVVQALEAMRRVLDVVVVPG